MLNKKRKGIIEEIVIFPYVGAFTCGYLNEKYILYSAITKQNMNYIIYFNIDSFRYTICIES